MSERERLPVERSLADLLNRPYNKSQVYNELQHYIPLSENRYTWRSSRNVMCELLFDEWSNERNIDDNLNNNNNHNEENENKNDEQAQPQQQIQPRQQRRRGQANDVTGLILNLEQYTNNWNNKKPRMFKKFRDLNIQNELAGFILAYDKRKFGLNTPFDFLVSSDLHQPFMEEMRGTVIGVMKLYLSTLHTRMIERIPRHIGVSAEHDGQPNELQGPDPNRHEPIERSRTKLIECCKTVLLDLYELEPRVGMKYEHDMATKLNFNSRSAFYDFLGAVPPQLPDDVDIEIDAIPPDLEIEVGEREAIYEEVDEENDDNDEVMD